MTSFKIITSCFHCGDEREFTWFENWEWGSNREKLICPDCQAKIDDAEAYAEMVAEYNHLFLEESIDEGFE